MYAESNEKQNQGSMLSRFATLAMRGKMKAAPRYLLNPVRDSGTRIAY